MGRAFAPHLAKGVSRPADLLDSVNADVSATQGGRRRLTNKVMLVDVLPRLADRGLIIRTGVAGKRPEVHYLLTGTGGIIH